MTATKKQTPKQPKQAKKQPKLSLSKQALQCAKRVAQVNVYFSGAQAHRALEMVGMYKQIVKDAARAKHLTRKEATKRLWRQAVAFVRKSMIGDGNVKTFEKTASQLFKIFRSSNRKVKAVVRQWARGKYGQPNTIDSALKLMKRRQTKGGPKATRFVVKVALLEKAIKRARRGQVTLRAVAGKLVL